MIEFITGLLCCIELHYKDNKLVPQSEPLVYNVFMKVSQI